MKTKLIIIGGLLLFLTRPEFSAAAVLDLSSAPVGPVISSTTHPNQAQWYSKSDLTISWTRPDQAYGFSFKLDQTADTVPNNSLDTTVTTTKIFPDLEDGIWYFHVKARPQSGEFGPASHFKIQIDTIAPAGLTLKQIVPVGAQASTQTPTVAFAAADTGSGIDHYQVLLDGQVKSSSATSPYTFDRISIPGNHFLKVRAIDRAANVQSAAITIEVPAAVGVWALANTVTLPVYVLVALNLLVLCLILLILILVHRRQQRPVTDKPRPVAANRIAKPRRTVRKKT